jgi:hypothetical protein
MTTTHRHGAPDKMARPGDEKDYSVPTITVSDHVSSRSGESGRR